MGKHSALRFPSADIARAAGATARAAAGRLLLFLRLLTTALCIIALAGPRFANDRTETQASGVDIMLVLDLSWSMMALDMGAPQERVSRFDIASDRVRVPVSEQDRFGSMLGRSVAMRRVFAVLKHAAASDATVLSEGETGTGKEAAAEALHQVSARANGPFVVLDRASIPHDLLESELFGHERGAFTDARSRKRGVFELAEGGTLYLDEIGGLAVARRLRVAVLAGFRLVVAAESEDLVSHLRAQGKELELLVFEDEGHDVLRYENHVRCYAAIADFFARHLNP